MYWNMLFVVIDLMGWLSHLIIAVKTNHLYPMYNMPHYIPFECRVGSYLMHSIDCTEIEYYQNSHPYIL